MRILKAGILYFALVFGAGFVLGTVRVLFVEPRIRDETNFKEKV
ncbi:MAG: hypothetical protein ABR911_12710 [Syntrophales bacterium]